MAETLPPGLTSEQERNAWLANVSELTSVITHEFNNILNGILLHVAVLKQEVPPEILPELEVIRGLGNSAAALIKKLQQYNSKRRAPLSPVDLNEAVRDAVAPRAADPRLRVDLAAELPTVQAKPVELRRLIALLLDQAAAVGAEGGSIKLCTSADGKRVFLRIEDAGPHVPEADLARIFEPFQVVRPGADEALLAVCHTLARHLQGSLRAENLTPAGMAFTVELSPVKV